MARGPLIVAGVVAVLVAVGAFFLLTRPSGRTREGDLLLTAVPDARSFAPREMPTAPVLVDTSAHDLAVDFGYRVAGTSYSYTLALRFPPQGDDGTATVTARHAGKTATATTPALRLWDAPRDAYSVALEDKFAMDPAVPALCIKAVIGPSKTGYDLSRASLCVAQRDGAGVCHPETLACGQIRARS